MWCLWLGVWSCPRCRRCSSRYSLGASSWRFCLPTLWRRQRRILPSRIKSSQLVLLAPLVQLAQLAPLVQLVSLVLLAKKITRSPRYFFLSLAFSPSRLSPYRLIAFSPLHPTPAEGAQPAHCALHLAQRLNCAASARLQPHHAHQPIIPRAKRPIIHPNRILILRLPMRTF